MDFIYILFYCVCISGISSKDIHISGSNETSGAHTTHEFKLRRDILSQYDTVRALSRPLQNSSDQLKVYYGMRLLKLHIEEATQTLVTNLWVRMTWVDAFLKWNKTNYGGLGYMTLPQNRIWTPHDITAVNTIDIQPKERKVDVRVRYDGIVFWAQPREYRTECFLDLTNYPYDRHTCAIWIQSLAGYGAQLDLQLYRNLKLIGKQNIIPSSIFDLDTYMKSHADTQEWIITSNKSERITRSAEQNVILMYSKKVALKFTLGLQRRPIFIAHMLIFPSIILSFVSTIIFWLPPERPDRNTLAMSLFGCFMIFLLILTECVPPSAASTPRLVWMYCFNLMVTVGCIVTSFIVINVCKGGETEKPVPTCIQRFVLRCVAPFLCARNVSKAAYLSQNVQLLLANEDTKQTGTLNFRNEGETTRLGHDHKRYVDFVKQWKTLGTILDRCLFAIFVTVNTIVIIILFPRP